MQKNRIPEEEVRLEVLRYLSKCVSGKAKTSTLIKCLTDQLKPNSDDLKIINGRSDTYFSQKVRNVVSHRNESNGIVKLGFATYHRIGKVGELQITESGRQYIVPQYIINQ